MGLEGFGKKGSGMGASAFWNPKNKFEKSLKQKEKEAAQLEKLDNETRAMRIDPIQEEYDRKLQAGEIDVPPEAAD